MHHYQDLIILFNQCFGSTYNTQLQKGDNEPIYLPANEDRPHNTLIFAHGFFSSALHECAHWLIAGEQRRQLEDFGYWYVPDGRNAEQQALFQQVEVKPQAMEWILSVATGYSFRVSVDNLNGDEIDTMAFKKAIHAQVMQYCQTGLSHRAIQFRQALCSFYQQSSELSEKNFLLEMV